VVHLSGYDIGRYGSGAGGQNGGRASGSAIALAPSALFLVSFIAFHIERLIPKEQQTI